MRAQATHGTPERAAMLERDKEFAHGGPSKRGG